MTAAAPPPATVTPPVCQPDDASNPGAQSTWKFWKPLPAAVPVIETETPFLKVVGEVGDGGGMGLEIEAFKDVAEESRTPWPSNFGLNEEFGLQVDVFPCEAAGFPMLVPIVGTNSGRTTADTTALTRKALFSMR